MSIMSYETLCINHSKRSFVRALSCALLLGNLLSAMRSLSKSRAQLEWFGVKGTTPHLYRIRERRCAPWQTATSMTPKTSLRCRTATSLLPVRLSRRRPINCPHLSLQTQDLASASLTR